LTISNSSISDNQYSGIYNSRGLTIITHSTISDNQSKGISNNGELRISNSNISGNQGGGIYNKDNNNNDANLTSVNSTISGNSSNSSNYSRGGGINNRGELTITNSTISGNSSDSRGGGIYNAGELTITNSTISGNSSNSQGGGIANGYGQLSVTNSTITLNEASEGAGVGVTSHAGTNIESVIANTIISSNLDNDIDLFSNYSGELVNNITSSGGNLIGTGNALDAFDQPTDQINVTEPGLGPLADNGGPTLTHLLESDSPGIDAGVDSLLPPQITTDQRGLPRISGASIDSGSVELQSPVLLGTPERDTLIGGMGNDTITGFQNRDSLTGGGGSDHFVYTSVVDRIDTISDFEVNTDKIVLTEVLESLNYQGNNAIADGYVVFATAGTNTMVQIDPDGVGIARPRDFILVENVSVNALNNANNFIF
jgi:Ca2+-binding RTX toxin-like protein